MDASVRAEVARVVSAVTSSASVSQAAQAVVQRAGGARLAYVVEHLLFCSVGETRAALRWTGTPSAIGEDRWLGALVGALLRSTHEEAAARQAAQPEVLPFLALANLCATSLATLCATSLATDSLEDALSATRAAVADTVVQCIACGRQGFSHDENDDIDAREQFYELWGALL